MCRRATIRLVVAASWLAATTWSVWAQSVTLDWRHIGNSAIDLALPSVATGPVDRVWYSGDASTLYARTLSGRIFSTTDFEQWRRVTDGRITPPPADPEATSTLPEPNLKPTNQASSAGRFYVVGRFAYRSDDGGANWTNLTAYKGVSILGDGLAAVAASPRDADEVAVASSTGVWRSVDGGISWTG